MERLGTESSWAYMEDHTGISKDHSLNYHFWRTWVPTKCKHVLDICAVWVAQRSFPMHNNQKSIAEIRDDGNTDSYRSVPGQAGFGIESRYFQISPFLYFDPVNTEFQLAFLHVKAVN